MPRSAQRFLVLPILCILAVPFPALAETQTLTAEGTYTMGEGETMTFAESMALQKAKQMALEQAGTYVESYTKVQNYQLTVDEIQTIAGGVLQAKVLDKTRTLVGDGLKFFVKIKASVTTDKVAELAQRIKGKNVAEEYKKLQEDYAKLYQEIEKWKQLVAKTPSGPDREAALDQIRKREKAFASTQKLEDALFLRLVSGETLVRKALDQQAEMDGLIHTIIQRGHNIALGEAKASPVSGKKGFLKLLIPTTLTASPQMLALLSEVANRLGGTVHPKAVYPLAVGVVEEPITLIHVTSDLEAERYLADEVSRASLLVEFHLSDGHTMHCRPDDSNIHFKTDYQRLLAAQWYKAAGEFFYIIHYDREHEEKHAHALADDPRHRAFLVIIDGSTTFTVEALVPQRFVENIRRISARFVLQENNSKKLGNTDFDCAIVR